MTAMEQLLAFLANLEESGTSYILQSNREAVAVILRTPSTVYEVEFFADGVIEIEAIGPTQGVREITLSELLTNSELTG